MQQNDAKQPQNAIWKENVALHNKGGCKKNAKYQMQIIKCKLWNANLYKICKCKHL